MDALDLIGAIASPVSSLLGSGLSAVTSLIGGSKNANAQKEAQEAANKMNYKIFKEQLGFTEDMWNKQNEYNTPENQRKRYEDAGINPYFALGNITGGNAESVTTPSANPMQAAYGINPGIAAAGSALGSGLADAGNFMEKYYNIQAQKEAVRKMRTENAFQYDHEINSLIREQRENELQLSKKTLTDVERDNLLKRNNELDERIWQLEQQRDFYVRSLKANTKRDELEAENVYLRNVFQRLTNQAFPKLNQAQLQLFAAQASSACASALSSSSAARLSDEERKRVIVQKIGDVIENGIRANNYDLSAFGLNKAELEAMRKRGVLNTKQNSRFFDLLDNAISWAVDSSVGKIFK